MTYHVEIVDYDPQWPVLYEEEKGRILNIIGRRIVAIECMGDEFRYFEARLQVVPYYTLSHYGIA